MPGNKLKENEVKREFGARVRAVRLRLKKSQEDLALDIGMDLTSINEIENGHRNPKLNTVFKIASALGIPSSKLLPF
ncbi:hypothetical protein A3F62_02170 [Candidatus Woesebacteria bacterium RIFCSPHIGHO2_12_FULL_44_11]|uniref:HTH cro/C1-type domain-containing protein n=1 Tax=Candidatus Woesebacteria bacterium RIFCSPLOWO2_01_FULL_44_14 TaxID=1802525 RepID=A0A1F8C3K0_9BACT|nr:MAG: hypothetical protein A3F62_02170 [Candidatus Woesebacteria bacterium RIFCSPHIGHO2_12_FULL_44_11]OGM70867.1 MAG: hypothetical protein A2975_01160 [Candidatus Woesebacteria bacterium RIFCSPLOWO2_01_FULL_44_14]